MHNETSLIVIASMEGFAEAYVTAVGCINNIL